MFRKAFSITLLVSMLALGTSGLMMIVLNDLTFQLQMHPVHKVFGILMCISACFHIYYNFGPIMNYLKQKKVAIIFSTLSVLLIFLFVVGMNKPIDNKVVKEIEEKMLLLESKN